MAINATTVASMPIWWGEDLPMGIFFAVVGFIGAAIMVFFYLGELDLLLGKSFSIGQLEEEIRSNKEMADNTEDEGKRDHFLERINLAQNQLYKEMKSFRNQGIILFLVIGSVIAAMFSRNMLEALGIGAGWTAIVGGFGIKMDINKKRDLREQLDDEDERGNKQIKQKLAEERRQNEQKIEKMEKVRDEDRRQIAQYEQLSQQLIQKVEKIEKEREEVKKKIEKEREEEREESFKKFRQILKKSIDDTYYRGYSDAIEAIAEVEKTTAEDLVDKLK